MSPPEAERQWLRTISMTITPLFLFYKELTYITTALSIDSKANGIQTGVSDYSVKHDCNLKERAAVCSTYKIPWQKGTRG